MADRSELFASKARCLREARTRTEVFEAIEAVLAVVGICEIAIMLPTRSGWMLAWRSGAPAVASGTWVAQSSTAARVAKNQTYSVNVGALPVARIEILRTEDSASIPEDSRDELIALVCREAAAVLPSTRSRKTSRPPPPAAARKRFTSRPPGSR